MKDLQCITLGGNFLNIFIMTVISITGNQIALHPIWICFANSDENSLILNQSWSMKPNHSNSIQKQPHWYAEQYMMKTSVMKKVWSCSSHKKNFIWLSITPTLNHLKSLFFRRLGNRNLLVTCSDENSTQHENLLYHSLFYSQRVY